MAKKICEYKILAKNYGFVAGPVIFLIIILMPFEGISFEAKIVIGMALWMGVWWITEAIPVYVTSFLPIVIFPIFNIADFAKTSSFYADRIVFLLLGGFFLAKAIEKNNLHQRFAFNSLKFSGTSQNTLLVPLLLLQAVSVRGLVILRLHF